MAEKISIMFEAPPGLMTREEKETGAKLLRDLQIDRAFRLLCPDGTIREAFLTLLCRSLPTLDETLGRQKTIQLLHAHPVLLDRLIDLIRRFLMTKNAWDTERSRLFAVRRVSPSDNGLALANARQSLAMTSHFLRLFLNLLADIAAQIDAFASNERYLGRLRQACAAATAGESMRALSDFLDLCEKNLANAFAYDIDFSVDGELMSDAPIMARFQHIRTLPPKKQKQTFLARLKGKDAGEAAKTEKPASTAPGTAEEEPLVGVGNVSVEDGLALAARAVAECDRYLTAMAKGLAERFSDVEMELYFYKACVLYVERMEQRNVRLTYPKMLPPEANTLRCRKLMDLLLLTESMNVQSVVPNDAEIGTGGETTGLLITGKNNSGKTVFLRSVGTAVFLSQCGLPIPAEEAAISLRRRIFTHFAKAEGELSPLSQAGRFEEEAAELAGIIREVEPCSLLLMNETFQTTAYDEGSEGMYYILRHISRLGCGFLFVTHLTKLMEMCRGEAMAARTSDDPRTRYKVIMERGEKEGEKAL